MHCSLTVDFIVPGDEIINRHWDANTTLWVIGNLDDSTLIRLYAINESTAITTERPDSPWSAHKELPNPGKGMIKDKCAVLAWPQGSQNEGCEIHIFSLDGDHILDYAVDAPCPIVLSLY